MRIPDKKNPSLLTDQRNPPKLTTQSSIIAFKKQDANFLENSLGNLENRNITPYENNSGKIKKIIKKHSFSDKK